jgi:hypothetical protein
VPVWFPKSLSGWPGWSEGIYDYLVPFADGPPASPKQLQYLLSLIQGAGHGGFRDARRPLELTSRQAGGKFTVGEASELIDRLLAAGTNPIRRDLSAGLPRSTESPNASPKVFGRRAPEGLETPQALANISIPGGAMSDSRADSRAELIQGVPAQMLADELARRGWTMIPPSDPF